MSKKRETKEQRKRTRRIGVCAFVLTMGVIAFVGGLYTVDTVTGRTLHGAAYRPSLTAPSTVWLPPRVHTIWELLSGDAYFSLLTVLEEMRRSSG